MLRRILPIYVSLDIFYKMLCFKTNPISRDELKSNMKWEIVRHKETNITNAFANIRTLK